MDGIISGGRSGITDEVWGIQVFGLGGVKREGWRALGVVDLHGSGLWKGRLRIRGVCVLGMVWGMRRRESGGSESREGRRTDGCSGEMEEEDQGHSPNKKADGRFECVAQRGRPMLIGVYFFLFRSRFLIPCRPSAVPLPFDGERKHGRALSRSVYPRSTLKKQKRKKERLSSR